MSRTQRSVPGLARPGTLRQRSRLRLDSERCSLEHPFRVGVLHEGDDDELARVDLVLLRQEVEGRDPLVALFDRLEVRSCGGDNGADVEAVVDLSRFRNRQSLTLLPG